MFTPTVSTVVIRQALSPTLSREQDLSTTHFLGAGEGAERGR